MHALRCATPRLQLSVIHLEYAPDHIGDRVYRVGSTGAGTSQFRRGQICGKNCVRGDIGSSLNLVGSHGHSSPVLFAKFRRTTREMQLGCQKGEGEAGGAGWRRRKGQSAFRIAHSSACDAVSSGIQPAIDGFLACRLQDPHAIGPRRQSIIRLEHAVRVSKTIVLADLVHSAARLDVLQHPPQARLIQNHFQQADTVRGTLTKAILVGKKDRFFATRIISRTTRSGSAT